ncbi:MAG: hypothetical protein ABII00_18570 [Elusimicrobiota bacterium]
MKLLPLSQKARRLWGLALGILLSLGAVLAFGQSSREVNAQWDRQIKRIQGRLGPGRAGSHELIEDLWGEIGFYTPEERYGLQKGFLDSMGAAESNND